jgi:hypothetical protein
MGKEIENRWRSKTKIAQAKIDKEKEVDIKSSLELNFLNTFNLTLWNKTKNFKTL